MNLTCFVLNHRRMILTLATITFLMGAWSWYYMPRQEDPKMRDYWASISILFPGTDAESMERLVVEPLEDELAEVEELREINTRIQAEHAHFHLELRDDVEDIEEAWDQVRDAVRTARRTFPEGVHEPFIDTNLNDQESVVLALTGADLLALKKKAESLKKKLLRLHEVVGVKIISDPGEQITILMNDGAVEQTGITPSRLVGILQTKNTHTPGGTVLMDQRSITLEPKTEFEDVEDILNTQIPLASGSSLPLSAVAQVSFTPMDPARNKMRYMGQEAIGLGIIPREGIHLMDFGQAVRDLVAQESAGPVAIHELTYQPKRVQARLSNLGQSLMLGIVIVAIVLLLFMGFRLGLVVASVVPLVAFSSLGLFATLGGALHQISIAALVIALGMLVDNAIVVAENIQMRIDQGATGRDAAVGAIAELAAPLASATGTTLAAFVPMLLSEGITAEFTKDLPIVIMLTLTISYLFAVTVTPTLSEVFLRKRANGKKVDGLRRMGHRLGVTSVTHPYLILAGIALLVLATLGLAPMIDQQFFPSSDRNQLVLELKLPEGAHLSGTEEAVIKLEEHLESLSSIETHASFIGRSAPHFYYNITQTPWAPHFAQILITTKQLKQIDPLVDDIRSFAVNQLPGVHVIPRKLEQGPPVDSPIEVRLYGNEPSQLASASNHVLEVLRTLDGVRDARQSISLGTASITLEIEEMKAAQYGLTPTQVASSVFGRVHGLPAGFLREGEDPIPILVRDPKGENLAIDQLEATLIYGSGMSRSGSTSLAGRRSSGVPLGQVSAQKVEWKPASIIHRNGQRMTKVISQLAPDVAFSRVQDQLESRIIEWEPPPGIRIEYGGQAEGSNEANSNMMRALPLGAFLLIGILLLEFNSFRRVGLILLTVPLAAAGVIPGLLLGGYPFGFMSFLGIVALVGVVVNNAIVLIDVIETHRRAGLDVKDAIVQAVVQRTRPILLTTLTTVAGLLPLALAPSTLWPPLAWPMVSGLVASTVLTLGVIPALYFLIFRNTPLGEPPVECHGGNPK